MILKKCNLCYNSFNRYLQGLVRRVLPFDSEPAVMPPIRVQSPRAAWLIRCKSGADSIVWKREVTVPTRPVFQKTLKQLYARGFIIYDEVRLSWIPTIGICGWL